MCHVSAVSLTTPVPDSIYGIDTAASPPTPLVLTPVFAQTSLDCPLVYSVTQNGGGIDPALMSFDTTTGALTIATSNSAYFNSVYTIAITCTAQETGSS